MKKSKYENDFGLIGVLPDKALWGVTYEYSPDQTEYFKNKSDAMGRLVELEREEPHISRVYLFQILSMKRVDEGWE